MPDDPTEATELTEPRGGAAAAGPGRGGPPHLSGARAVPAPIARALAGAGGEVPFSRFMEWASLHPEAGYYTRGSGQFGRAGDFVTIPARVPFFNQAVAALLADLVDALSAETAPGDAVTVVEVGGGTGDMAAGVLSAWERSRSDLRDRIVWEMVEPSKALTDVQRATLERALGGGWLIHWHPGPEDLPQGPKLVVSNEVVDALPVHLVDVCGETPRETWVRLQSTAGGKSECGISEYLGELTSEARRELIRLFGSEDAAQLRAYTADGTIEARPAVLPFLRALVGEKYSACVVTVDYGGWPARAGTQRADATYRRTARAYLRQQRQDDLTAYVGRQDLTADVDFGALATHGEDLGLECLVYTTVAALLAAAGGAEEVARLRAAVADDLTNDVNASHLDRLLDTDDAGGLFKLMVQVREGSYRA